MYDVSIPVFKRALHNLSTVLEKGESHAKAKGAVDNLLHQRLIIDMFPLTKQIQVACDTAARSAARMAGTEAKAFSDTETTFEQERDRIARTIAYLDSFKPEQINAAEGRDIARSSGKGDVHDKGLSYLTEYALPNFFFQLPLATRSSGFAASVTTPHLHDVQNVARDYWSDRRFRDRRPGRSPVPDNLYMPDGAGLKQVTNDVHGADAAEHDIGGPNVLVGTRFWHFGENSQALPGQPELPSRVSEPVAIGHLDFRERFLAHRGVVGHDLRLIEDVRGYRINIIIAQAARLVERHGALDVIP